MNTTIEQIEKERNAKFKIHLDHMVKQENSVETQIKALPKDQQNIVRRTQRVLDLSIKDALDEYLPEAMYKVDAFLIAHKLMGGEGRVAFLETVQKAPRGKTFVFAKKSFYKSSNGFVMDTNEYIYTIEKALIRKNSGLGFIDHIKLAFRSLGSK